MLQPKKQLSRTAFAAAVLSNAMTGAAAEVKGAEREEWIQAAKARYQERCGDSIPEADALVCAQTCFGFSCMAGEPGNYYVKHRSLWLDPMVAADQDMERWGHDEGSAP